jgi:cell wall assembly regulator SMI1
MTKTAIEGFVEQWREFVSYVSTPVRLGSSFVTANSGLNLNGNEVIVDLGPHPSKENKSIIYTGKDGKGDLVVVDTDRLKATDTGALNIVPLSRLSESGEMAYRKDAAEAAVKALENFGKHDAYSSENMRDTPENYAYGRVMKALKEGAKPLDVAHMLPEALSEIAKEYGRDTDASPKTMGDQKKRNDAQRGLDEVTRAGNMLETAGEVWKYRKDLKEDLAGYETSIKGNVLLSEADRKAILGAIAKAETVLFEPARTTSTPAPLIKPPTEGQIIVPPLSGGKI